MNLQQRQKQQQALIEAWTYPAGTPVIATGDDGTLFKTITTDLPTMIGPAHTAAIMLEGINTPFALENVRLDPECLPEEPAPVAEVKPTSEPELPVTEEPKYRPLNVEEQKTSVTIQPEGGEQPLKVLSISVRNVMGLEEYELNLDGDFTMIEGRNGQGKSSLVNSVLTMLGGGYPAEMIRVGSDKAEIVGVFSNGMEAKKRIGKTSSKSGLTVKQDGKSQQAPQSIINSLVDEYSVNPLKFVQAKPQEQVELLLKAIPMSIQQEELKALSGLDDISSDCHALVALDNAHKSLYKTRTDINAQVKRSKVSVERLAQSLPSDFSGSDELKTDIATLDQQLQEKQQALESSQAAVEQKKQDGYVRVNDEMQAEIQKIHEHELNLHQQLEKIQQQIREVNQQKTLAEETAASKKQQLDNWANEKKAALREKHQAEVAESRELLASKRAQAESVATYENTRRIMEDEQQELNKLEVSQKGINASMKALKDKKAEFAANIPISEFEITDKGLTVKGVPFAMVNTAEKMRLAVEVAALRLPKGPDALRLVVIDGAESMDRETIAALTTATKAARIQLLLVRTTDSPLSITHGSDHELH